MANLMLFPQPRPDAHIRCQPITTSAGLDLQGCASLNIAGGGISFPHETLITVGTMVALAMHLPDFPAEVIALACIRRCQPEEGQFKIDAEFHWVGWGSSVAQEQIAHLIQARLAA